MHHHDISVIITYQSSYHFDSYVTLFTTIQLSVACACMNASMYACVHVCVRVGMHTNGCVATRGLCLYACVHTSAFWRRCDSVEDWLRCGRNILVIERNILVIRAY